MPASLDSNEAIRRLGERIAQFHEEPQDRDLLIQFRQFRSQQLGNQFAALATIAGSYPSLSSCRVKRLDAIIRKLRRLPTMKLPRMDDVVGFRTIAPSVVVQQELVRELCKNLPVRRVRDYLRDRHPLGYRGIHIIFEYQQQLPGSDEVRNYSAEVQVRTWLQHLWATASESFGEQVKEGGGSDAQRGFLAELSEIIEHEEEDNPDKVQLSETAVKDINFYIIHFDKTRGELISCDYFNLHIAEALDQATYLEQLHRGESIRESVLIGVTSSEKELTITHLRYFRPFGFPELPEFIATRLHSEVPAYPGRT